MLRTILWTVVCLFPASEIALALLKRADPASAQNEDRGSMRIVWLAVALGIACAVAARSIPWTWVRLPPGVAGALALAFLLAGLAIRWAAIATLGRHFTVDVAIQQDHTLVQHGLYRLVRHPSYSGLLLAFFGLGLSFASWLSLLALMLPITLAIINRIAKEERALLAALGPAYALYCARTKRLFPGLV
jgi:protein-S-isoprenylcysteine O-methyltransferase Ste14